MSEQAPEARGSGGGWLQRAPLLGVPNWLWLLIGGAAAGTGFILYRRRKAAAAAAQTPATSTQVAAACSDANGQPVDCNSLLAVNSEGQSQYEQLTSQLTGLSGQQAALASAIQQAQGQPSTPPGPSGSPPPPGPEPRPATPAATPQSVQVPTVTGIPIAAAAGYVEQRGLQVSPALTTWSGGGFKNVVSQSPPGGTMVPAGSTVTLST